MAVDKADKKSVPSTAYNVASTTHSGFLEFKPRDMKTQVKYDAMSPTWEGIESSDAAIARGDYSLDSAETTRRELRAQYVPKLETPKAAQKCVIQ